MEVKRIMVIREFLRKYGWAYLPGMIFLALNSYIQSKAPAALGDAIDLLSDGAPKEKVLKQAGIIALIGLGVFAARFVWRLFIIGNARKMEVFLREKLYLKLLCLPLDFYQKHTSGDLMAYAISDVGAVRITFGPVLAQSFNGIVIAGLSIIGMISEVDWRMTLLALAPVPLAAGTTIFLGNKVQKRFGRVQKLFSKLSGFVGESISGIKVTKAFAKESERERQFDEISDEMRDANVKLAETSSLITPAVTATFGLSYAAALIIGGNAVIAGSMGAGTLVTFLGYLLLVQQPIVQLGNIINRVQRGLASWKRLSAIFDEPSIKPREDEIDKRIIEEFKPAVRAKNLTCRREGADHDTLSDVNFDLRPGRTLGISGSTGSGKTTLLSLLMKLIPAGDGEIFVSERDINKIPAATLRSQIGWVPQDGFLFSATIAENIAFSAPFSDKDGKPIVDMERVKACAKIACIADEIEKFPDGYETEVGERGTHLSGGQKQRVSLARALYSSPKLLLLDDTLSAVDNITEKKLIENLGLSKKHENSETSIIIVSHRLSALVHCDEIFHLESGKIVERGTHEELLALGGYYASTYEKQQNEEEADKNGK